MKNLLKLNLALTFAVAVALFSCEGIKQKTKEGINKGGETVGKTATEFLEGVGDGVEKTLAINVEVSDRLKEKGLTIGRYVISNTTGGSDNLLTVYMIFINDFSENVLVKAFDESGTEIGRLKKEITGKKDDAGYYEFEFDPHTNLESKGKVTIE